MTISKPAIGSTGWNTATDAVIDRVNDFDGIIPGNLETVSGSTAKVAAHTAAADPHGDRAFATASLQPLDADLTTIAGLTATTDNVIQSVAGAWASRTPTQAKTALALVKGDVGLGSVDNTSDTGKPVSTATQTALDAKAQIAPNPASGRYFFTSSPAVSTTSASLTNQTLRLVPWLVDRAITIDRIGVEITTVGEAGSKLRLGIYADDGAGYPGAMVVDAGQIAGDSATVQELTISQALLPGVYWIGAVPQSAPTTVPTVRCASNWHPPIPLSTGTSLPGAGATLIGYSHGSVSGALPASFTATVTTVSTVPRLFVRRA